ncbi:MAG: phosphate-binding protein [Candidatus Angelobacter sp.]|nr:phosphate-binding protein [Candidatus Angelobacter sp.]
MKHKAVAILIIVLSLISGASAQNNIVIRGSDTMILLGQRCSQGFSRKSQQANFTIQGGGVKAGLEALNAGKADIVQSENAIPGAENATKVPAGVQAIVVYVNRSNLVTELSTSQVRGIFMGEIQNWKQVGGKDEPIVLYAGESSTGILSYFQESALKGEEPYPFEGKSSTKSLLETIASTPNGIGYAAPGFDPGTKTLRIKNDAATPGVDATLDNIRGRRYPLSRYVYWYIRPNRSSKTAEFLLWFFSSEGQITVESVGFEPLLPADRTQALAKVEGKKASATTSAAK